MTQDRKDADTAQAAVAHCVELTEAHSDDEGRSNDDILDDEAFDAVMNRQPPDRSLASKILFKICVFLCATMPIATLVVAARAVFMGLTGKDTGHAQWSPPSSQKVPMAVTLVLLLLLLLIGTGRFIQRRCGKMAFLKMKHPHPRPRPRPCLPIPEAAPQRPTGALLSI